ncbi:CLUMA_CG017817, isoform A [Clunio marinus]|uniref:CLUMA_CG017817, isoform A n=1 Tax=Clunio marinus TaxID=568069 RepID=A0A1J1IX27_9DIPT|nr:CLUMA_CG017817, isoform A [Clunio marinus]
MGVRQLDTFMKRHVENGFASVDIHVECMKFERSHGKKPVLVIDLLGFISLIIEDKGQMLCGGRHQMYEENLEQILKELSKHADLVFFEDKLPPEEKKETILKRDQEKDETITEIIKRVKSHTLLSDILVEMGDWKITRTLSHYDMVKILAKRHGLIKFALTKDCDAEIAQYANDNPAVLAVIANDSDFLIFLGRWRYFSISDIKLNPLRTKEYNKKALRNTLRLNDQQLTILSSLSGNDVIRFPEVEKFLKTNLGERIKANRKFDFLGYFIHALPKDLNSAIEVIAKKVFNSDSKEVLEHIKDSINQYDTIFESKKLTDPLEKLCVDKQFGFTIDVLKKFVRKFFPYYCDITKPSTLMNVIMEVILKAVGIINFDEKDDPEKFSYYGKKTDCTGIQQYSDFPIFPSFNLPPLMELLEREKYPNHKQIRFQLLKWLINEKKLEKYDLNFVPKRFVHDILTLVFMTSNGFITTTQADIILLTIYNVEQKVTPREFRLPVVINENAFQIAHLYNFSYGLINKCFEVTGLLDSMSKILNFDGVAFHELYLKNESGMALKSLPVELRKWQNGFASVDIHEECTKFERSHGKKPVLVIDLLGLLGPIVEDKGQMLCGGRHQMYEENLEEILNELSKYANLVFFEDKLPPEEKKETILKRDQEKDERITEIIKRVKSHTPLSDILVESGDWMITRTLSHYDMVKALAKRHGLMKYALTKDCDAEIAQYANNNPAVLAVIANDSDFLIFPGRWRYFSNSEIKLNPLRTKEYNKKALRNTLRLNDQQLTILSSLSGNDVLRYPEVEKFLKTNLGEWIKPKPKFFFLRNFIHALPRDLDSAIKEIAEKVFNSGSKKFLEHIKDSINQYDTFFETKKLTDPLEKQCVDKQFNFIIDVLKKFDRKFFPYYCDITRPSNSINIIMEVILKAVGIINFDEKDDPEKFSYYGKKIHSEDIQQHFDFPIFPSFNLPPLMELLEGEKYPNHKQIRFQLLKWLINEKKLEKYDLNLVPKRFVHDILTLVFMTSNGFITTTQADIILLTVYNVEQKVTPKELRLPVIINENAFQIAHLYNFSYGLINKCFEVTGLLDSMSKILNFDGVAFHELYLKNESGMALKSLPVELRKWRIYR